MTAIVQINFPYSETSEALLHGANQVAPVFSRMEGLLWKVWLVDETRCESGGIYLFATREQAEAYVNSEVVTHLKAARPDITIKVFDTLDEPGLLTRAPTSS